MLVKKKYSAEEVKQRLFAVAEERGLLNEPGPQSSPDFYFLKYAGFDRILMNELTPLSDLPFVSLLRDSFAGKYQPYSYCLLTIFLVETQACDPFLIETKDCTFSWLKQKPLIFFFR